MKLRTPKVKFVPVRVTRAIIPENGPWRIEDGIDVDERFFPTPWLFAAMGARVQQYFMGRRNADER
jgi:hypothetical protein